MAPILLDTGGIVKVAVSLLIVILAVFSGGFITGYHKANLHQFQLTETRGIELPAGQAVPESALEHQLPLIDMAGAEIDVDGADPSDTDETAVFSHESLEFEEDVYNISTQNPDATLKASDQVKYKDTTDQSVSVFEALASSQAKVKPSLRSFQQDDTLTNLGVLVDELVAVDTSTSFSDLSQQFDIVQVESDLKDVLLVNNKQDELAQPILATTESVQLQKSHADRAFNAINIGDETGQEPTSITLLNGDANSMNARYSIQVGMYGQAFNAQTRVKRLNDQGLNAYLSEYLNKQQATRYNVRFGYFETRSAARKALRHYTDRLDGSGYLVKVERTLHAENSTSNEFNKTAEF